MKEPDRPNSVTIAIGLGRSGIAAARFLKSNGQNVVIFEESRNRSLQKYSEDLRNEGIQVELGMPMKLSSFEPWLDQIASVVITPGIPWDHATLEELRIRGIKIEAEISIAWKNLKRIPWVGITGTNGKTTVTHMLHHVLQNNQIDSRIGGNVGTAASELALALKNAPQSLPKWMIMELSSYQIESAPEISPQIGIWTTLTPDHLERHGSIENYFKIKSSLLKKSAVRIYNADDKYLRLHQSSLPKGLWVSTQGSGSTSKSVDIWISPKGKIIEKNNELFDCSALKIRGEHNIQNLLLVTAAARIIGLSAKEIERAIISFKGLPHRLEKVGEIRKIEIINDSKATNFDSAEIALKATLGPLILIAGGQSKLGIVDTWIEQILIKASAVVLFGESRDFLMHLIQSKGFKGTVFSCQNLDEAVDKSIKLGISSKSKSILFSPGCASFDQYQNFEKRGDHFKKLIKKSLDFKKT